jgi:hypothetical protein
MPLNPISITGELALGIAIGQAVSDVVEPKLRDFRNEQSRAHPNRPLPISDAALALLKGYPTALNLAEEARVAGFNAARLGVIEQNLRVHPGAALLLRLWRRRQLSRGEVEDALQHELIPEPYRTALLDLYDERLDPAVIATAIQRGIMKDPGILPVGPPSGTGKVPKFPVSPLDPLVEARDAGIDLERLFVETAIVGLPASPDLAARMTFRKIIDKTDFRRAISEGNTRNEWADSLFEGFRQIPTAHDGIEGRLRGWIDDAEMYAETARHGMSKADTDLLFKITGRPLSFHQVFIGERRGGVYDGPTDAIDPAFLKALRESNIRPEWYSLAWAQRYSYPSAFVLRALTEAGDLTQAESHEILLFIGWHPTLAEKVSARWAGGVGAAADPNVKKAQGQLWTRLHRSYIGGETDTAAAQDTLGQLGIVPPASDEILALWLAERALAVKQLTAAQVKKAYAKAVENPATGQPWTRADAVTRLIQMGYTFNDASTFLDE